MQAITIPQKNLIAKSRISAVSQKYQKFYAELDHDIKQSLAEYKAGKYYGPFSSIEELKKSLKV